MPKTAEAPEIGAIEDHVPVKVAARTLATTNDRVLDWIRDGKLAAINIATGKRPAYRISIAELRRFINELPSTAPVLKVARRKPVTDVPHYFR